MKKDGFGTRTAEGSAQGQSQNQRAGGAIIAGPHPVDKVLYIIIAFFLGGFGIQESSSERLAGGVGSPLLWWTRNPVYWAWIRIIMAILKPSDSSGKITL